MSKKEENIENLSMSKQRKLERAKKRAEEKKQEMIGKVIGIVIGVLIIGGIAFAIGQGIYKSATKVEPSNDFSAQLDDNGFIKNFVAKDNMTLADYKTINVPKSEIEYSDESVDADIEAVLESHQVLSTDTDAKIKDGDKVSIEYVGSVDGVEFEGGNTNGTPADLTIGSGSYVDDFEQQLIGHGIGDEVTVEVTFPEDYGKDELNGKDAVFIVNIDGIYEKTEFTDEFVAENLSEYADTVEGYRQYLKDSKFQENLKTYVENYLKDNSTVNKYPKAYLKNLKSIQKFNDQESYEYMNQMYMQYYGSGMNSFEEYVGMSESEYDASLDDTCKETCKEDMVYQAILESEGIKLTEAECKSDALDATAENRGLGDAMKDEVRAKAIEIAMGNVNVQ